MIALPKEVLMSSEPTPSSRRDLYSPDDVYWLLEHYHELDAQLGPRDEDPGRVQTNRPKNLDAEKNRIIRRADIDYALVWLSQLGNDPAAADAIYGYYIEILDKPDVADKAPRQRPRYDAEGVARWQGVTVHELNKRINRGVYAMARKLGYPDRRAERDEE